MLMTLMPRKTPQPGSRRDQTRRILIFGGLLLGAGCASPTPKLAARQTPPPAPPSYAGTIVAIRPESSSQDPTGSIQQIMSILGETAPQPAPQVVSASEIVIRMPGDTIKTSVQPHQDTLAVGSPAAIVEASDPSIKPD